MAVTEDSKTLFTGSWDGCVKEWHVKDNKLFKSYTYDKVLPCVICLLISPNQ